MYEKTIESIKKEMVNQSISPAELSRKTEISKGALSNLFNYKRKMSLEDFLKICDALKFNPLK